MLSMKFQWKMMKIPDSYSSTIVEQKYRFLFLIEFYLYLVMQKDIWKEEFRDKEFYDLIEKGRFEILYPI